MPVRIGLMGFGRIGRNVFRILHGSREAQIVAISDIMPKESIEYLLRWDTVHGPFGDSVEVSGDSLYCGGQEVKLDSGKAPGDVDWQKHGADFVIEATTKYASRQSLKKHISQGAKHVILAAPPDDGEDIQIAVMGVNDHVLDTKEQIISGGSVTVNCVAPMLKILHDAYGVTRASMTSVHAYTNAQRLADVPHGDCRGSRSAVENIIPTKTSTPRVLDKILPELAGKLHGIAINVPVPDGSIVDLTCEMSSEVSVEQINKVVASAAGSAAYKNILDYATDPIVSSDIIGSPFSATFDSRATKVLTGNLVKTLTWYDNGWGYACRIVDLIKRLAGFQ